MVHNTLIYYDNITKIPLCISACKSLIQYTSSRYTETYFVRGTSLTQEKWLWGFSLLEDTACNPFPPEKILSYPIEQKGLTT
jgi:hypothetical protein